MLRALRDHYLRIDARSLGLFRVLFALVLIGDLFRRWYWLKEFYSNEGVLPNHNHLFNLKDTTRVWSVLHAFSTPGENHFAFLVFLIVYGFFLVGYKTRVFHALALVALVSLSQRNILLENAGNYAAVALLAFTLFLPCGRRFSLDSLLASMEARREKNAADLALRVDRTHRLDDSPVSIAALAVLVQIALIFACTALQQTGAPWRDGSALHYALHVDRWVGDVGVAARAAPAGLLRFGTFALYIAEIVIPILIFVPLLRRVARGLAAVLIAIYGLTFGLLFDFGLWGWSLVAASALVLNGEWWHGARLKRMDPARIRTVIYDADCGVCLLICRLLRRLDAYEHLVFRGNDTIERPAEAGEEEPATAGLPAGVTAELVQTTVVVVDPEGGFHTRGRAIAEIVGVLPLGRPLSWLLRAPGIVHLLHAVYDAVAVRRLRISEILGYGACGLPSAAEGEAEAEPAAAVADDPPPAARLARLLRGSVRELAAAIVLAAMLTQTARENPLPVSLPESKLLEPVALWPRMIARWDMLAPAPPTTDGIMILDAQTRGGKSVDPLTGAEPDFQLVRRPVHMGQLWGDYLDRVRDKARWGSFEKAFKDYIVKGGPLLDVKIVDNAISGLDAYWVTQASPAPGGPAEASEPAEKAKLFTHSRGGRLGTDRPPTLRTDRKLLK